MAKNSPVTRSEKIPPKNERMNRTTQLPHSNLSGFLDFRGGAVKTSFGHCATGRAKTRPALLVPSQGGAGGIVL